MAKNKTAATLQSVTEYINNVPDEVKRKDSFILIEMMSRLTGEPAIMWGPSIVGFGSYHYKYASGHEGDSILIGFSPRSTAIVLYLFPVFEEKERMLANLGKYKAGKGCIYIKKLSDVHLEVLEEMLLHSIAAIKQHHNEKKG